MSTYSYTSVYGRKLYDISPLAATTRRQACMWQIEKKVVGPDELPAELLKLILDDGQTALKHYFHDTMIVIFWRNGGSRQQIRALRDNLPPLECPLRGRRDATRKAMRFSAAMLGRRHDICGTRLHEVGKWHVCVCVRTSRLLPGPPAHAGQVAGLGSQTRHSTAVSPINSPVQALNLYPALGPVLPLLVEFIEYKYR